MACLIFVPTGIGALAYLYGLANGWFPFWSPPTLYVVLFIIGIVVFTGGLFGTDDGITDTLDFSEKPDELGYRIMGYADETTIKLEFPDKDKYFHLRKRRSDGTIEITRVTDKGKPIGKTVQVTSNVYRFGSTPAQSAVDFIKREVNAAPFKKKGG